MNAWDEQEDTTIYKVVVNHEEQYSLWPDGRDNPLGWQDVGKRGSKAECLAYIQEIWTDMRPLSLRRQMEEAARRQEQFAAASPESMAAPRAAEPTAGDDLVQRLSTGEHAVEAVLRPENNAQALKACIDRGYVHIKFVNTRGGTALGLNLDRQTTDLSRADFVQPGGCVHLVGGLTLNYVKVRCVADIDLSTLTGQGHLEPVDA